MFEKKEKEKVLAIIPARFRSKRIPNKNIKFFLGKPLIVYTIEQARACSFVDRVIVDTDSSKIAEIALECGAEIPFLRPARLAGDRAQIKNSILYFLRRLKKEENYSPSHIMILQTTSPLREIVDIENCWKMMQSSNVTTVLTVCPTHPRLYYLGRNNEAILVNDPKNKSTNIQYGRQSYLLNGCFVYIIKTGAFLREKSIITKKTKAVICPKWRSVDLDTPEDWALAEYLYKNKEKITKRIEQLYGKK